MKCKAISLLLTVIIMEVFGNNNGFVCRKTTRLPYHSKEFWDAFHEMNVKYEWFVDMKAFFRYIDNKVSKFKYILLPGIGTSQILNQLKNEGYTSVTYSDYCQPLVERLKAKYPDTPCYCDDIINTNITKNCYDVIIDKGLLDCYMRGTAQRQYAIVKHILNNYHTLLTNGGQCIYIGSMQIEESQKLIDPKKWIVEIVHPLWLTPLSDAERSSPRYTTNEPKYHLYHLIKRPGT